MENSHQEEEEISTPTSGDDSNDTSEDLSWLDGETEEEFVQRINADAKTTYKSAADIAKALKEAQKKFSEAGRQQKATIQQTTPVLNDMEVYFFEMKPEAQKVEQDLRRVAQSTGKSLLQAWKEETWLQEKAQALSREEQRQKADAKKVIAPSNSTGISNDYSNMSDEEIMNLPPEEAGKAIRAKAGRI